MLTEVAAKLDAAMAASQGKPVAHRSILDPMLQDGSLRLSARHELQVKDPGPLVAALSIPFGPNGRRHPTSASRSRAVLLRCPLALLVRSRLGRLFAQGGGGFRRRRDGFVQ
jgi:hypothetical protein